MSIAITGNTYPVKDQLKALGGRWDAARKAWMVPEDKADKARALVSGAPKPQSIFRRPIQEGFRDGPCRRCQSYCYGDCTSN